MMNLEYYREVDRLQDGTNFRDGFQTELLLGLLCEGKCGESDRQLVLRNRLEAEMHYMYRKSVFVAMKWLIFIHQAIQKANFQHTIDSVNTLLHQMSPPLATEKIDQYLLVKLVNPYKQYLDKLACRKYSLLQGENSMECEGVAEVYWEYNFINYALTEFAAPIRQFKAFFSQEYPHLNSYIYLIGADLSPLYGRILRAFEENMIGQVTFIEVEQIGMRIGMFVGQKNGKRQLSATADHTNSDHQKRTGQQNCPQVTPFCNLESSNLSLNFNFHI